MLTVYTEKDIEKVSAELICESCGKSFSCGANVGECWCFAFELEAESLTDLREKYKNCLCQKCLGETKPVQSAEI